MKHLLAIPLMFFASSVLAINSGQNCATYLAKEHVSKDTDGLLIITDKHKFNGSVIEDVIKLYSSKTEPYSLGSQPFIKGLTTDASSFESLYLVVNDLQFQNGIFYVDRSQDGMSETMEYLAKELGGSWGAVCVPYKKM